MFPCLEVIQVALMLIRFALEADSFISGTGMKYQPVNPFEEIDDIKKHIQQLLHLGSMDQLMIEHIIVQFLFRGFPYEQHPEDVDRKESTKRNDITEDYFHRYLYRIQYFEEEEM